MARRKLPYFFTEKPPSGVWWVSSVDYCRLTFHGICIAPSRAAARALARDLNAVLDKHEKEAQDG